MEKKIFIVEDEADIILLMETILKKEGYAVDHTDNGRNALERIRKIKPDLLILDVMVPGVDGLSLLKQTSEEREFTDIPVIIVSAMLEAEELFANNSRVKEFIQKPFTASQLRDAVKKYLPAV